MFQALRRRVGKLLGFSDRKPSMPIAAEIYRKLEQRIRARYEAAQNGDEYVNIWANADQLDADSANSIEVRRPLVWRSRYEVANNGYSDGIAQTYATDLIGKGPTLRMNTASTGFNQMIEAQWEAWAAAVGLRRKLWCMAHAKHQDGEAFAIMAKNPMVDHPVKFDLKLRETEQCHTPYVPFNDPTYIDGIKFDDFGNPIYYDFLKYHPGSNRQVNITLIPEQFPADQVLHWFKLRRPNQHRGMPESASTLNLGAAARRWREANLSTAEKIAEFTLLLKTLFPPEELNQMVPFDVFDLSHGMLTALPNNVEPFQLKSEHPAANYYEFHKSLINEQARPKSMPLNKALCNSADYNYASGRLDHQTYYGHLDWDRQDCAELVLDKMFRSWLMLAVKAMGWLGGDPLALGQFAFAHTFDWTKHAVADVEAEANANRTKLQTGQIDIVSLWTEQGLDLEDFIDRWCAALGLDEDELRQRLADVTLPPPKQPEQPGSGPGAPPDAPGAQPAQPASKPDRSAGTPAQAGDVADETFASALNGNGHAPINIFARRKSVHISDVALLDDDGVPGSFCPTGPGGGVDPTCSPGGGGGESARGSWAPPTHEDPAGSKGNYLYHTTNVSKLAAIQRQGLKADDTGQISVAPHLESAKFWGEATQAGETKNLAMLRIARKDVRWEMGREEDGRRASETNPTAEGIIHTAVIPAAQLDVYMGDRWQKLPDVDLSRY
jgi:capsid protein